MLNALTASPLVDRARSVRHVWLWIVATSSVIAFVMTAFVATTAFNRLVETPELKQLFDIGREANLPTFASGIMLASVAAIAAVVAAMTQERRERRGLWIVSAIVAYLAIDESTGLHERTGDPVRDLLGDFGAGWPTYYWLVPGIAGAVVLLVVGWSIRTRLDPELRRGLGGAVLVFLSGAIVVESINGWVETWPNRPLYFAGTMVEETLEMAASVIAGAALLAKLDIRHTGEHISITRHP